MRLLHKIWHVYTIQPIGGPQCQRAKSVKSWVRTLVVTEIQVQNRLLVFLFLLGKNESEQQNRCNCIDFLCCKRVAEERTSIVGVWLVRMQWLYDQITLNGPNNVCVIFWSVLSDGKASSIMGEHCGGFSFQMNPISHIYDWDSKNVTFFHFDLEGFEHMKNPWVMAEIAKKICFCQQHSILYKQYVFASSPLHRLG